MHYYQLVFDPVIGKHVSIYTDAGIMSALSNLADMTDDADVSGEWEVLQETLTCYEHLAFLPISTNGKLRVPREWHIWRGRIRSTLKSLESYASSTD